MGDPQRRSQSVMEAGAVFPGTQHICYLNTAAEGLAPQGQDKVLAEYALDRQEGSQGRPQMFAREQRCRERVARLLAVSAHEIAFAPSASRAINAVIAAIPWRLGDALVTTDLEYISVDLATDHLRRLGMEVRCAPSQDGIVTGETVAGLMDERTRLVIVSLVSYKSGGILDLETVSKAARACQIPLLVDASQSLGVFPMETRLADFLISSGYKWLLGAHGVAVMFVNEHTAKELRPGYVGWRSVVDPFAANAANRNVLWTDARRFEEGMAAYPSIYALDLGLETLSRFDGRELAQHALGLATEMRIGLERIGIRAVANPRRGASSSIVVVRDASYDLHVQRLRDADVIVWGREGRLRASFHLYNRSGEVARLLEHLAQFVKENPRDFDVYA